MKEINTVFHFTKELDRIKQILNDGGFKPSYAIEKFGNRNILVPMISFSNISLRDVGNNEVIDYGNYAIGFDRLYATKIELNPVCYIYENSEMEKAILNLIDLSTILQGVGILKDITQVSNFTKITDHIKLTPLLVEVENLLNSITKETSDEMISAIKSYSAKIYENAYYQLLLAKPYRITNKIGETKVAYNEREWRKSYKELVPLFETDKSGKSNPEYAKWSTTQKPHFNDQNHMLKIGIENIKFIVVNEEREIQGIEDILLNIYGKDKMDKVYSSGLFQIGTLENLKMTE